VKNIFSKIKRIKSSCVPQYIKYCGLPVDENLVLVEGGQGTNINGNMFAMLRELQTNPRWKDYTVVFTVVKKTYQKAKQRMEFYGFKRVILSIRNSKSYCRYLATAKYIMTDNSFPPYFNKRKEQVFLNTWHGTPLKTLGKANKSSLSSLANVQKNYLMSDYALFPNRFTQSVFMNDYDLRHIYTGKTLIANYPRNYIFYDKNAGIQMKSTLGYSGKRVYAYMPTWRDAATKKQKEYQLEQTYNILRQFDEKLDDSSILLVNLHFLLASEIDCNSFKHVHYFPSEYDTYEVLNACDGLITDYSSVFFDYAVTRKKIILFAYDKDEYLGTRGLYMPFEDLPFPIVEDVDSVIAEMSVPTKVPDAFLDTYCPNGWENSCELLFEMMVDGKTSTYELENAPTNGKKLCLIYGGALTPAYYAGMKYFVEQHPDYNHVVVYRRNLTGDKKEAVDQMSDDISVLGLMTAFQFRLAELLSFVSHRIFKKTKTSKTLKAFYQREAQRLFYGLNPSMVVDFSCAHILMSGILTELQGEKFNVEHGDFYTTGSRTQKNIQYCQRLEQACSFKTLDYVKLENDLFLTSVEDGLAHSSYRKFSRMRNILPVYYNHGDKLCIFSMFRFRSAIPTRLCDTVIRVGEKEYKPKYFSRQRRSSKRHFGFYKLQIPLSDVVSLSAMNMVALSYKEQFGLDVLCHILYCTIPHNLFLGLRGPMNIDRETNTVAIFRQSVKNRLNIYVRSSNVTDAVSHRVKQFFAFFFSLFWHSKKARKLVLLYEKNSSKYEESASVLFEELIDSGHKYAYFIVDKDYEYYDRIPEQYRDRIIHKYSFKHYLYFFRSKTFIGTEAVAHSIDLKTFNKLALAKVGSKRINYVFLQHGVMYMVSLDSESRKMFKRKKLKGKYRVVVSSQKEADHFTTLGRHLPEDLYISGLPKFDRNRHNENADKIVIMPTWRPWEINEIRADFAETPYFKMLMRIYNSVPDHLKDKVIILPHPLIVNELSKMPHHVSEKIIVDARYDDILQDTELLITDYSSIAYDAFYRGARVIFYWEEKDDCMAHYGPSTKLMLNEENVYGDFLYSTEGLADAIERNYYTKQTPDQIQKYSRIVEFRDGNNTQRLIQFLKEDGII